jgi:hypothetical protein
VFLDPNESIINAILFYIVNPALVLFVVFLLYIALRKPREIGQDFCPPSETFESDLGKLAQAHRESPKDQDKGQPGEKPG